MHSRWNLIIDPKKFPNHSSEILIKYQSKLSLCIFAHWLETDGYLSGAINRCYVDIIKSETSREALVNQCRNQYPYFEFLLKNLNTNLQDIKLPSAKSLHRIKQMTVQNQPNTVESRMLTQHVKTHLLNVLVDRIVQNYSQQEEVKGKLKFKRVINSIIREYSDENNEGNALLIQTGVKRLEKETKVLTNVELSGRFEKNLDNVKPKVFFLQLLSTIEAYEM